MLVAICTRQRPLLLKRLLLSLRDMTAPSNHTLEILIVENDEAMSVDKVARDVDLPFTVHTVLESRIGLANARNRTLDFAQEIGADYLIGVDDDEWVDRDWVCAFERALPKLRHLDILFGRFTYVYHDDLSKWRREKQFSERLFGQPPAVFNTANYLISKRVFSTEHGLGARFDPHFNLTGGEDSDFFLRLKEQHDMQSGFVPDAVTYEDVKDHRATYSYAFGRTRREMAHWYGMKLRHQMDMVPPRKGRVYLKAWRYTFARIKKIIFHTLSIPVVAFRQKERLKVHLGDIGLLIAKVLAFVDFVCGRATQHYDGGETAQVDHDIHASGQR